MIHTLSGTATREDLLATEPPGIPEQYAEFWQNRYKTALSKEPHPKISHGGSHIPGFEVFDLSYLSTDNVKIGGWALIPMHAPVSRAVVVSHGYGGRQDTSGFLPLEDAAYVFPCCRGISRSHIKGVPEDPYYHVLYNIDDRERYILGGCVEDVWLAVSATRVLFPAAADRIGYMGASFGGGIGAMAMAWDPRMRRAQFEVPSFGHHKLRLRIPSEGSARAIQNFHQQHPHVLETLTYYDAAVAAQFIRSPVYVAAALSDHVVAPAGQFAIYNALKHCDAQLYVLEKGHSEYPNAAHEHAELQAHLKQFFAEL